MLQKIVLAELWTKYWTKYIWNMLFKFSLEDVDIQKCEI